MTMSAHEDTNHEFENIDVVNGDSPIQKNEIVPVDKNILTGTKKNAITFTVETQSYVDALERAGYDDTERVRKAISAGSQFGLLPLR